MRPVIYWLRQDFRLADNPALNWAAHHGAVIPVFIQDPRESSWALGGASRWWLHHSILDAANSYAERGIQLVLRRGDPLTILRAIAQETKATAIGWNRCYEPAEIARDTAIKQHLQTDGLEVSSHNGHLLFEPWTIATAAKTPFKVYTPFSKACFAQAVRAPTDAPNITPYPQQLDSDALPLWHLTPRKPDWAEPLAATWTISRAAGLSRLRDFVQNALVSYKTNRDRPDLDGTSALSPYLRWGLIGIHEVWQHIQGYNACHPEAGIGTECYLKELLWREFAYHLLYHNPALADHPFNPKFSDFPWGNNPRFLRQWQQGRTGYPIVDAGMRQLWQTGWMHNRVRMIVASFLVKDLMIPWQEGERWFWDTLVDADLASNAASWQWVAGCGADAAPYFRVFNPILQGIKFDPNGDYVRRYVPELAKLPNEVIHEPWTADTMILERAGVALGTTYPAPIVDHGKARNAALAAYKKLSIV